jgi:homoserine O-acetyltransferase
MDHHDVGRGRGGIEPALSRVEARSTVVAIDSDRLYPPRLQYQMAGMLPGGLDVRLVHSPYGHDAFLVETGQVGARIHEALGG